MITLLSPQFWLGFVYFLLAIFFAFYIPGNLLIYKSKFNLISKSILSAIVGYVIWGLLGYLFGFLGITWAFYLYLFAAFTVWVYLNCQNFSTKLKFKKNIERIDLIIIALIMFGTFTQIVEIFFNGITTKNGIFFPGSAQDLIYHAALTNAIVMHFPPFEPGAAGIVVKNYHYFSNLVTAYIIKIFHLSLLTTSFQYFGTLFSISIGLSALTFARTLKISKAYTFWLIFFLYFSGDVLYLFLWSLGKGLNMHYVLLYDPTKMWTSPSRVAAVPVMFGGLTTFVYWIRSREAKFAFISSIIFASLIAVKVYAGLFAFSGVFFLIIYLFIKREFRSILPWLTTFILGGILYLYVNKGAGGLVFVGTWRFEDFVAQPIFNLSNIELARQVYLNAHSFLRVIEYELIYAFLYFLILFGTLNLAFLQTRKSLSLFPRELNVFLIPSLLVGLIAGLFFLQKTGGANSSQFIINWEIFVSIYASLSVYYFFARRKTRFGIIVIGLIILLSAPRVVSETFSLIPNISKGNGFYISNEDTAALSYLKNNTDPKSIIMVDDNKLPKVQAIINGKKVLAEPTDQRNFSQLYSYYVPMLSQRSMYSDGGAALYVFGVDVDKRTQDQNIVFGSKNPNDINRILLKDHINYLYTTPQRSKIFLKDPKLISVFKNGEIQIFKVD